MPSNSPVVRALALPLIGALVSSGLLLGTAGTSSATATSTTTSTTPTTSTAVAATSTAAKTLSLQQRKKIRNNKIRRAVRVARNQIGDPYNYGSAGPNAFDCSGLTSYAFAKAGINLPRTSGGQAARLDRISKSQMKRGDLMFFYGSGGVYHLGIYVGRRNGERIILHSSQTGRPVQRDPVWTSSWFAGTLRVRR